MLTSRVLAYGLGALVFAAAMPTAMALDGPRSAAAPVIGASPTDAFKSVRDAFKTGIRDYNAGDKVGAVRALEYAATQGHTMALWKLGRMYAEGDGVGHDDLKAFEYFSKIADQYADESPASANARFVSSAFVALGGYFLEGISGSYVKRDVGRAVDMFYYAASYYGDPDAQYGLARLYLEGLGVDKDSRQAARWLHLSAEKGHHAAQALLGNLLILGDGVPRQGARGLMWLTMAREAADPQKDSWIIDLHDRAFSSASESDRQAALAYMQQYLSKHR